MTQPTASAAPGLAQRADGVAASLDEHEVDALITFHLPNVRWLTGFTGSMAGVIVGGGARTFVTDFRYLSQSAEQVGPEWKLRIAQEPIPAVAALVAESGIPRVGFEARHMTVEERRQLEAALPVEIELVPVLDALEVLRAYKDAAELAAMRRAAAIADAAFQEVVGHGLIGRTERDVALDLEIAMRRRGATSASFPPIVASGSHAALPHAVPRDRPIEDGTLVMVDAGAVVDGYCSDCTRTFAAGEPTPHAREVYELVLRAQEAAVAAVRAGRTAVEIDAVARDIIVAAGHAEHFGHGVGHGVGIEMSEIPRVNPRSSTELEAGNVVTIEPGVYIPGELGVRIEDLVRVTSDGPDVLTSQPKALRVVG
jgi:Xaa-Pro aminopeptidase